MGHALVLGTHMLPVTVDFEDQQQHAARVEVVDGSGTPWRRGPRARVTHAEIVVVADLPPGAFEIRVAGVTPGLARYARDRDRAGVGRGGCRGLTRPPGLGLRLCRGPEPAGFDREGDDPGDE
jgi:hypothetical protein